MTLGGVALEITYTAVADDVIKVHIVHHKGTLHNQPQFELNEPAGYKAVITEDDKHIEMTAGKTNRAHPSRVSTGMWNFPTRADA